MNKRLSLLLHEPCEHSYFQKTARTELSDEHHEEPGSGSQDRNSGISIVQSDLEHSRQKFIEFEEFNNEHQPVYQFQPNLLKKKLNIDVPDTRFDGIAPAGNRSISEKPQKDNRDRTAVKEPPAPSKGSDKSQARVFVFPVAKTNGNTPSIKHPCSIPNITLNTFCDLSHPCSPAASSLIQHQPSYSPNHHSLLLQAEGFKKDILIRDSQIALLEKIISDNIQPQYPAYTNPYSHSPAPSHSLLQQKDDLNLELMAKITELTGALKQKSQQLALYKYENHKMECLVEAMQNEAYVSEKRHQSEILRDCKKREQSTHWEEDRGSLVNAHTNVANNNVSIKQIQIRKYDREEEVKKKRVVNKTKEDQQAPTAPATQQLSSQQQVWYCQTSKHKSKLAGVFDFKQSKENVSEVGAVVKRRKKDV